MPRRLADLTIEEVEFRIQLTEAKLAAAQSPKLRQSADRTRCPNGHPYPEEPAIWADWNANAGSRRCMTCYRTSHRRAHLRRKLYKLYDLFDEMGGEL